MFHHSNANRSVIMFIFLMIIYILHPRTLTRAGIQIQEGSVAAVQKVGGKVGHDRIRGGFTIDFRGSSLSDAGLVILKDLEVIRSLDLRNTQVTDAGLVQLKGRNKLETLKLGSEITDGGLIHAESIPDLRSLSLRKTHVSDEGIRILQNFRHLKHIDVRDTKMTNEGIAALRQALPKVKILGSDEILYFPEGAFDKDADEDDSKAQNLHEYLNSMGEPPLWSRKKDERAATVYRLLWVPSFDHPIAVRIVNSSGSIDLYAEELEGTPTTKVGKIGVKRHTKLTEADWTRLQGYLDQTQFWKMSTNTKAEEVLDGDELVCEGLKDGNYHIVYRSNEVHNPKYNSLCWYLLSASGLDVKEIWKEYHSEKILDGFDK